MTKILLLTGMTPDPRLFSYLLSELPQARLVDWIPPIPNETVNAYAKRLATGLQAEHGCVICGISFGGIVANELSICLEAKACVLVSSIRTPLELPPWFRVFRMFPSGSMATVLSTAGKIANSWPKSVRTKATFRLTKLAGEAGSWYRWATAAVLSWEPTIPSERISTVQFHGTLDRTFPIRYVQPDVIIPGGGHVLRKNDWQPVIDHLKSASAS